MNAASNFEFRGIQTKFLLQFFQRIKLKHILCSRVETKSHADLNPAEEISRLNRETKSHADLNPAEEISRLIRETKTWKNRPLSKTEFGVLTSLQYLGSFLDGSRDGGLLLDLN